MDKEVNPNAIGVRMELWHGSMPFHVTSLRKLNFGLMTSQKRHLKPIRCNCKTYYRATWPSLTHGHDSQSVSQPFSQSVRVCGVFGGFRAILLSLERTTAKPSSETQGQLVGTTRFSWAKVYNKRREPLGTYSHRTSSRSVWNPAFWLARKTFFWPISEEEQPGDSHAFLHEVVFLINRRRSVARLMGTFLRRASGKKTLILNK